LAGVVLCVLTALKLIILPYGLPTHFDSWSGSRCWNFVYIYVSLCRIVEIVE
jgi:hypothetical protein